MQKKHFLKKLFIDPCPILEYFVPDGDDDIIKAIVGENGIQDLLDVHTVNAEYARSIATRMHVDYEPIYPTINPSETQHLLSQGVTHEAVTNFLNERKFPLDLIGKYEIASWKHTRNTYTTWAKYFPFNLEAMVKASFILHTLGFETFIPVESLMVCPSYDREGNLNNLVFRFVNEHISQLMCKWLFSHGRQATFGLDKIDPSKPVFLVEGFYDYVAMVEMGYNAVGLGSAFISDYHWSFLGSDLDLRFLLDADDTGRKYSDRMGQEGHQVLYLNDEFKDPYEWWINKGEIRLN